MSNSIDIPEGRTNDYLVHGVFAIIGGSILFLAHWSLTVLLVGSAIALFSVSSGIEIDLGRREARVYKALGKLRSGGWVKMDRYDHIAIHYTNESQAMGGRGPEITVRVRTYDLHFTGPNGASRQFHDFTDYVKARRCAEIMVQHWSLTFSDEIQERRQRSQAHSADRRR